MAPQASLRGILTYAASFLTLSPPSVEIPNLFSLLGAANTPAPTDVVPYIPLSGAPSCPVDGPTSCWNDTPAADSCCFMYPGGRMLLAQFWDREVHAGGAEEDWTIHGLWYVHVSLCRMRTV